LLALHCVDRPLALPELLPAEPVVARRLRSLRQFTRAVQVGKLEPLAPRTGASRPCGDRERARENARRTRYPPRRAVLFLRTVAGTSSLLRATFHPRCGRHGDLRKF